MIGFDLQEVERIKDGEKLLERIALQSEIAYIMRFKEKEERIASLWAVKEATFKALGISAGEISYKEIELCHHENGAPYLRLHGRALSIFQKKFKSLEVSISHQKSIAGAVVVAQ